MRIFTSLFALIAIFAALTPAQSVSDLKLHKEVFETVWSTVNKAFYDPGFNGVDWNAVHSKYGLIAAAAKSDEELYTTINEMLSLLKVSHVQAGSSAAVAKRFKQTPGITGLGVRSVDGRITVFRSLAHYPAERAGIRPGHLITKVDGIEPASVEAAGKALLGSPNTSVRVTYLDEKDVEHEVVLNRQALTSKGKIESLDIYAIFASRLLDNGIGYISFSSFVPFLNEQIKAAFDSMKDAPAIILDLRGNSGGDDSVSIKLADRLFEKETQLMLIKTRNGINRDMKAHGNKAPYAGKFVVLIDEFSASAAEDLTAGLQDAGRAYVIGKRSIGEDLDAEIKMLPDGGMLIYPFGLPRTPKGVQVEGRGVTPDLTVELSRSDLLAGRDTQLRAAIEYLKSK
jgi:carboxyl-terminal processing protease